MAVLCVPADEALETVSDTPASVASTMNEYKTGIVSKQPDVETDIVSKNQTLGEPEAETKNRPAETTSSGNKRVRYGPQGRLNTVGKMCAWPPLFLSPTILLSFSQNHLLRSRI